MYELLNQVISHVKYVFHMWKRSDFIYEMKISYEKLFQFHMLFTCEMTYEIFVRSKKGSI